MKSITVIGAGLAGAQAALSAAKLGVQVKLFEMRPTRMTPAHKSHNASELVCSNSLGGEGETNAKGLLQAEMRLANASVMHAADANRLPAGAALAVDREGFSAFITAQLQEHPHIVLYRQELVRVPDEGIVVLASGPLTSDALAEDILARFAGNERLSFYDAAAPVLEFEGINTEIVYRAGRYGQEADYLNCPFNKEEYLRFYARLEEARSHTPHDWEKLEFFEGCMPIEEIARRGIDTPRFGPLKPKGLPDPRTKREPYAVAQLRQEDAAGQLWSIVGFQTGLKWGDQKEVVRLIPGLEHAEIARYGVMHRNTYLCAPKLLLPTLQFKAHPRLFTAGVLAGTEGYLESAATGWLAGMNAARLALGLEPAVPPPTTMLGGLVQFLATAESKNFQPMNTNWALVPELAQTDKPLELQNKKKLGKREKRPVLFARGLRDFGAWLETLK
ncbi:MAG: methylenetetrahydrofolate--tRNA-(uracil(54)-C(5))-methyltransferase (FADH(2)-oxidizing) TrmFO [Deinococcales bacterium]